MADFVKTADLVTASLVPTADLVKSDIVEMMLVDQSYDVKMANLEPRSIKILMEKNEFCQVVSCQAWRGWGAIILIKLFNNFWTL